MVNEIFVKGFLGAGQCGHQGWAKLAKEEREGFCGGESLQTSKTIQQRMVVEIESSSIVDGFAAVQKLLRGLLGKGNYFSAEEKAVSRYWKISGQETFKLGGEYQRENVRDVQI